ncbi:MAG: ADP-ribosylglycohydrolase family protein [Paenibacillaceae bacterium]|nr:ADP-ribosylglycohydrolase family protein [Paenibacillaceae bacterium]
MNLSQQDYRNKLLGCWMGKNIGGTLGAPFEWKRQLNAVTFYTQPLNGEPLPNDDLDLQLVWLAALEERGIDLSAGTLAEYWLLYITPHWMEYGNAKRNLRAGLMPPLSGDENNPYRDSCGAFIRSEIWACIAPGCPDIAVRYAYDDAIVDHGHGEGMYAELFFAALESAAFVERDTGALIRIGLSYIPEDCLVARAIRDAIELHREGGSWVEARNAILARYRGHYMTYAGISDEDRARGFADGPVGMDAPSNAAIVVIAWLYGRGDFGESLCIAVNCGEDTDCTAATLGAIFGIIGGIDSLPSAWMAPIGRGIKTICLNMGELGGQIPATIDELADRTERIARQVLLRHGRAHGVTLSESLPTDRSDRDETKLLAREGAEPVYARSRGPVCRFDHWEARIEYADGPYARGGTPTPVALTIVNNGKTAESVNVRWFLPDASWQVAPAPSGKRFVGPFGGTQRIEFALIADTVGEPAVRFAIELTLDGKPTVMLVPVVLLNGSL